MTTLSPPRATPSVDVGDHLLSALIVDADSQARGFLEQNLAADRFAVQSAASGEQALAVAMRLRPDVAVIDVGLPRMSGYELVALLRDGHPQGAWDPGMAIILVSDCADVTSVIRGIERGADDYVAKPFHYAELLARMGVHIRRARGVTLAGSLRVGPLEIDRRAMVALVRGRPLDLSAKEFALLCGLARDPRQVVTKSELLRGVWGCAAGVRTRTVDSHASRLRGKLARAGLGGWVRNVWGQGYRLLPEDR